MTTPTAQALGWTGPAEGSVVPKPTLDYRPNEHVDSLARCLLRLGRASHTGAHGNGMERRRLAGDTRGVAYVEYVTLLVLVTLTGAVAVFSVGLPLLQTFRYAQAVLAMPIP